MSVSERSFVLDFAQTDWPGVAAAARLLRRGQPPLSAYQCWLRIICPKWMRGLPLWLRPKSRPTENEKRCALTGATTFVEALSAILGDYILASRTASIRVERKRLLGEICWRQPKSKNSR